MSSKRPTDVILDTMCGMNAVKSRHAVSRDEIKALSGLDEETFTQALQDLIDVGAVGHFLDREKSQLHLTSKGRDACEWE